MMQQRMNAMDIARMLRARNTIVLAEDLPAERFLVSEEQQWNAEKATNRSMRNSKHRSVKLDAVR